jgi:hypothetical protein
MGAKWNMQPARLAKTRRRLEKHTIYTRVWRLGSGREMEHAARRAGENAQTFLKNKHVTLVSGVWRTVGAKWNLQPARPAKTRT